MADDLLIYTPKENSTEPENHANSERDLSKTIFNQSLDDYIKENRKNRTSEDKRDGKPRKDKNRQRSKTYFDPHPKIVQLYLPDRQISKLLSISQCELGMNEKASIQVVLSKKH